MKITNNQGIIMAIVTLLSNGHCKNREDICLISGVLMGLGDGGNGGNGVIAGRR